MKWELKKRKQLDKYPIDLDTYFLNGMVKGRQLMSGSTSGFIRISSSEGLSSGGGGERRGRLIVACLGGAGSGRGIV